MLKDGSDVAACENVSWKQQDGDAIDGRGGGAGQHVGCPRADRRGANECSKAIAHFREGSGGVHHRLLIAAEMIREIGILLQCLPDAGDVSVAENTEAAGEESVPLAVTRDELVFEKLNDGLRSR